MIMLSFFQNIWLLDFEYSEVAGGLPRPWCAVSVNQRTNERMEWRHTDSACSPIYSTGPRDVVVAYGAEAEGRCIRALGWPIPQHCIDLLPIFRCYRNRFGSQCKASLLDALVHFNLPGITSLEKEAFRKLAIRGAPFSDEEMKGLVAYCATDVEALAALLPKLVDVLQLPHALLMGRYTIGAVSAMQYAGIPVKAELLNAVIENRENIHRKLIEDVDRDFGVYADGHFVHARFASFLERRGIPWPRTELGRLALDDETFKSQSLHHPELKPLRDLRKSLAALRTIKPAIGADGRNRAALMPFSSITGRNQPSNSSFLFGWPKWLRHMAEPTEDKALITLDFEQQEFLIGAVLSQDRHMIDAYVSGDPYMHTAIHAGSAPLGATKESHLAERNLFKTAVLALQYGCGVEGLALRVGNRVTAKKLIEDHRRLYSRYHSWNQQQVDRVLLGNTLVTPFGWSIAKGTTHGAELNTRSIGNWAVQAAGGDILRIATIALVEHDFKVVAPIHDALVVECDAADIDDVKREVIRLMQEASQVVLDGENCRVESKVTLSGNGYYGKRRPELYDRVISLLGKP